VSIKVKLKVSYSRLHLDNNVICNVQIGLLR